MLFYISCVPNYIWKSCAFWMSKKSSPFWVELDVIWTPNNICHVSQTSWITLPLSLETCMVTHWSGFNWFMISASKEYQIWKSHTLLSCFNKKGGWSSRWQPPSRRLGLLWGQPLTHSLACSLAWCNPSQFRVSSTSTSQDVGMVCHIISFAFYLLH